jgi:hypothetical protein
MVIAIMKRKIPTRVSATKIVGGLLAVLVATVFTAGPAAADDRDHRRDEHERHEGWHGDIHRFHEHDYALWRGGRWVHGRHDGRRGWWWIVGGVWYFYPAPVYPYPDPYLPPGAVAPLASGAQQYWYYCSNPAGYYPYVPECATVWQAVPENAPTAYPPAAVPSAPVPPAPVAPAPAPANEQYWYYCSNPPGYYPTVPRCPSGWQRVPATPQSGPAR